MENTLEVVGRRSGQALERGDGLQLNQKSTILSFQHKTKLTVHPVSVGAFSQNRGDISTPASNTSKKAEDSFTRRTSSRTASLETKITPDISLPLVNSENASRKHPKPGLLVTKKAVKSFKPDSKVPFKVTKPIQSRGKKEARKRNQKTSTVHNGGPKETLAQKVARGIHITDQKHTEAVTMAMNDYTERIMEQMMPMPTTYGDYNLFMEANDFGETLCPDLEDTNSFSSQANLLHRNESNARKAILRYAYFQSSYSSNAY